MCVYISEEKKKGHSNFVMTLKHVVFFNGLFINNSLIHDFKPLKIFSFIHAFAPKNIHKTESKSFLNVVRLSLLTKKRWVVISINYFDQTLIFEVKVKHRYKLP